MREENGSASSVVIALPLIKSSDILQSYLSKSIGLWKGEKKEKMHVCKTRALLPKNDSIVQT